MHTETIQHIENGLTPTNDSDVFWMSMHLFYADSMDKVLLEVIMPTVTMLLRENKIATYFFIRYWEGGPHIRLRMKGTKDNLLNTISPIVSNRFGDFVSKHPSLTNTLAITPEGYYPIDSVQWIAYEPETNRYGGEKALPLAEKLFQASSTAVLNGMRNPNWTPDHALGVALQLHLSLIHSTGMSLQQTVGFCNWMAKVQLHYAARSLKEFETDPDAAQQRIIVYFHEKYAQQKGKLVQFGTRFWSALESQSQFDKEWLNTWHDTIRVILTKLIKLTEEGKVEMPYFSGYHDNEHKLMSIYSSYIHMTNNRLGIPNSEEPYIAFLLARILEAINE